MASTKDWWNDFFTGLVAESIRRMSSDTQTLLETDFLVQSLELAPGASILDVPCGNGRLSLALASRGYNVTGVDISSDLLDDAHRSAREKHLSASFERRDMRDLPWTGTFDRAFCFGNSFGYFDDKENGTFLRAIHDVLKPGGRFVLETRLVAESVFLQVQSRRWYPMGDLIFLHDTRYEPHTSQLFSTYILLQNGREERKEAVYQVYTCRELVSRFKEAGFGRVETYGSLKREPFQLGSPGLWVVAHRD